ncbi:hypothetical protein SE17_24025 [Kouleothrix aurantiaca]|uniref:DUF4230 domain-containing protein n=1 Tax=Kouleothrix aurantiaca TaxID=186479 RepID=A0A0P9DLS3_9CHLR|nr:hypothetical protein SE17_24025 [Kouleothrix aurantiaca]
MGRYDDDRPRRRDSDEYDDYPRRRDSLMERRLRRAQDEELYDDDYEEPRYARPRAGGGGGMGYGTVGGGGCASSVLYLLLGGIALLLVALIVGPQLMSTLVPNVPQQVREIVATPTTTLRDRGGTILQIRSLNRLETQSFAAERVIEAKVERGNPLDLLLGDRLLLIASGEVVAGVDLSKLRDGDVTISPDGKSITLKLPPSEIFSKKLDNDRTRVYDRQQGFLSPDNKDLETQARSQAEVEILNAACENNIMQKSANDAQRSMEQFLKLLDFTQVTVTSSAGPCVAPAGLPGAATAPAATATQ